MTVPYLVKRLKAMQATRNIEISGWLGDLTRVVKADTSGNVFVTLTNGVVITARNAVTPNVPRLPVVVGYNPDTPQLLKVLRSRDVYEKGFYPEVGEHAEKMHQWPGPDTLWVRGEQFTPGLLVPNTGLTVRYKGSIFVLEGVLYVAAEQDIDVTSYIPATGAKMGLLQADSAGVVTLKLGTSVDSVGVLTYADIPTPDAGNSSLKYAVKLYAGQTTVRQGLSFATTDLIDLRWISGDGSDIPVTPVTWDDIVDKPDFTSVLTQHYEPVTTVVSRKYDRIYIDGTLAVLTDVSFLHVDRYMTISKVVIRLVDKGTADSTIVDVHLNGTTIFTDQGNRPTLAFDDALDYAESGTPAVQSVVPGDVLTFDIDAIATDAETIEIVVYESLPEIVYSGDEIVMALVDN